MPVADGLNASLGAARGALGALGPRPSGDPAGIRALAKQVRKEATEAASAGRVENAIPGSMVFEGPAAARLAANAEQAAESFFAAQRTLDDAATSLEKAAHDIAQAQHAWDRKHSAAEAHVRSLERQIASAAKP